MSDPIGDKVDASDVLPTPAANDTEAPHVGMNGKPCRCTAERRA